MAGCVVGWVDELVGGWLEKMKIELSSASARLKLAELGNNTSNYSEAAFHVGL